MTTLTMRALLLEIVCDFAGSLDPWAATDVPPDPREALEPLLPVACDAGLYLSPDGDLYVLGVPGIAFKRGRTERADKPARVSETEAFDVLTRQIKSADHDTLARYVAWATNVGQLHTQMRPGLTWAMKVRNQAPQRAGEEST